MQNVIIERSGKGAWHTPIWEGRKVGPSTWVPDSASRRCEPSRGYLFTRAVLLCVVSVLIGWGLLTGLEAKADVTPVPVLGEWEIRIRWPLPFQWPLIWIRNIDAGSIG